MKQIIFMITFFVLTNNAATSFGWTVVYFDAGTGKFGEAHDLGQGAADYRAKAICSKLSSGAGCVYVDGAKDPGFYAIAVGKATVPGPGHNFVYGIGDAMPDSIAAGEDATFWCEDQQFVVRGSCTVLDSWKEAGVEP